MGLLGDLGLLILGISVAFFLYKNLGSLGEIAEGLRAIGNEMHRGNDIRDKELKLAEKRYEDDSPSM